MRIDDMTEPAQWLSLPQNEGDGLTHVPSHILAWVTLIQQVDTSSSTHNQSHF